MTCRMCEGSWEEHARQREKKCKVLRLTGFEICRNKKSQVPEVQSWGRDARHEIRKAAKNQML